MPITYERLEDADIAGHMAIARAAGLDALSLRDVYDEYDVDELNVAAWDEHPNTLRKLVANRLYTIIKKEFISSH